MTTTFVYAIKYVSDMGAAVRLHRPAGNCELGFRVADIDAFFARKAGKGIDFISPPTLLHGQKLAKFKDTDGAQCSLSG